MKGHTYHHKSVIIGNSLDALICGFESNRPVLTLNAQEPLFFERFSPEVNLKFLGFENKSEVLNTPCGTIEVGIEKYKVYRRLSLMMSLAGLLPLAGKAVSLRQVDNNTIKVVLDHARSVKIKFENIVVFENSLLEHRNPPKYMVLDWMNVRSGMIHPFDKIENSSDFVNCIHFYPSKRIDGNHTHKKDLVSVSYLTREQMENYEFSDTYARFKIVEQMKAAGIRGARNGKDLKNPDKYKYYAVKVESDRRIAVPLYSKVSYQPKKYPDNKYLQYLSRNM